MCLSFELSVKPIRAAGLDTPFCPAPFLRAALGSGHAHVRVPACSLSCLPPTLLRLCGRSWGAAPSWPGTGSVLLVPVLGKACLLLEDHTASWPWPRAVSVDLFILDVFTGCLFTFAEQRSQ